MILIKQPKLFQIKVYLCVRMPHSNYRPEPDWESVKKLENLGLKSLFSLPRLKLFCKEEGLRISVSRCANVLKTYLKRLIVIIEKAETSSIICNPEQVTSKCTALFKLLFPKSFKNHLRFFLQSHNWALISVALWQKSSVK